MKQQRNSFNVKIKLFRTLGLLIFLLILAAVAIILFAKMEETIDGRGVVVGVREYTMKSKVRSTIDAIYHRSGDVVKKGELLLTLDDRDFRENLLKMRNNIVRLEAEVAANESSLAVLRLDPLPKEYRHAEISYQEYLEREKREGESIAAYRMLHQNKAVSLVEFQRREIDYLTCKSELERLKRDVSLIKDGYPEKIIKQGENLLALLKTDLANQRAELAFYEQHEADYRFVAPEDGTVTDMPTRIGIYVEPGQSMITLAASGPKKFIAYVNEKDIYKVREEQRVRIASSQYNYFEHGYFYGTVYAIDELPQLHGSFNCYAVRIMLDESVKPLRLGSTGGAEIMTGKEFIFKVLFNY